MSRVVDINGQWVLVADTEGMTGPVRCGYCREVYDVHDVTVTARYADCSVWTSPCCNRVVDDRPWKSRPDIEWLS